MSCCRENSTSQRSHAGGQSSWGGTGPNGGHCAPVQKRTPSGKKRARRQRQQVEMATGATPSGGRKKARTANGDLESSVNGVSPTSPRRRRQQVHQNAPSRSASARSNDLNGKALVGRKSQGDDDERPISLGMWHNIAVKPTTKALEPEIVIKLLTDNDFAPGARPISFSPDPDAVTSWIFKEGEDFHTRRKAAPGALLPHNIRCIADAFTFSVHFVRKTERCCQK